GTVQEMQDLKGGDKFKLTTKNWLTSQGTWVDGKGITPDIEVTLDQKFYETYSEEDDNQLKMALEEASK
ncbi:MAG: peptidase S41, partial [Bacilli bacterium]|nr:peptidase S41 [Bacilli bacterium]